MCEQKETWDLEDGDVEQDDGLDFGIRGLPEVIDVTVRAQAADDGGTWRRSKGVALIADGDFAVVADADAGVLAPNVGSPGTFRGGVNPRAFVGERLLVGGVGCLAELAVKFVLIGVGDELVEELVG